MISDSGYRHNNYFRYWQYFSSQSTIPGDFCQALKSLSPSVKYNLLKNPKVLDKNHVFPTQYLGGCNHSFRPVWLSQHPWMVYNEKVDGVFCIAHAILFSDSSKGNFVCKPFRAWHKKSEKSKEHESCLYHQKALKHAEDLK